MFSTQPASGLPLTFVIDTQTGRIWRQTFYTDIKDFYFVPQPYISADGKTVSAVPPTGVALESLTMQNIYDKEIDMAGQKKSESK